jgi:hypothetical protein
VNGGSRVRAPPTSKPRNARPYVIAATQRGSGLNARNANTGTRNARPYTVIVTNNNNFRLIESLQNAIISKALRQIKFFIFC